MAKLSAIALITVGVAPLQSAKNPYYFVILRNASTTFL